MTERDYILSNPDTMKAINNLMMNQEPSDRYHYRETAMEAVALNPAGKSRMVQKLYQDIISKSNINYGKIPDSKGNLTAYQYYEEIKDSIDILNKLLDRRKVKELDDLNRLHDAIIACRADFEYGYRFNVDIIIMNYQLLVLSLHEVTIFCILAYTNYLKETKQIDFSFKYEKDKDRYVIEFVETWLRTYDKGEWSKLVKTFKNAPKESAMEASLGGLYGYLWKSGIPGKVIVGVITIVGVLSAMRLAVYYFYTAAATLDTRINAMKDFIKAAMEDENQSQKATAKQSKMYAFLSKMSNFLEAKILKTSKDAGKNLTNSDRTDFSPAALSDDSVAPNTDSAYII